MSEIKLTEDERDELGRLFGWVPEPEPLEQMLAGVERILHDRLRGALKEAAKENVKRLQLESELRDMEIERNALRISLEGVLEKLDRVEAIKTHNGTPISPKNLRWAATHEALSRSFIFDVLMGLADVLDGADDA